MLFVGVDRVTLSMLHHTLSTINISDFKGLVVNDDLSLTFNSVQTPMYLIEYYANTAVQRLQVSLADHRTQRILAKRAPHPIAQPATTCRTQWRRLHVQ